MKIDFKEAARKTCTSCGEEKFLNEFYKNKSKSTGYEAKCKTCTIKTVGKYYDKNKIILLAQRKEWANKNILKIKNRRKDRYWENREKSILETRKWEKSEAGIMSKKAQCAKRRERKTGINPTIDSKTIKFIFKQFNKKCFLCGSIKNLQIDHHYPSSKGYPLSTENGVVLCSFCNNKKRDKMPEEFYNPSQYIELVEIYGKLFNDNHYNNCKEKLLSGANK